MLMICAVGLEPIQEHIRSMAPWAVRIYFYDVFRTGQGPMLRFLDRF